MPSGMVTSVINTETSHALVAATDAVFVPNGENVACTVVVGTGVRVGVNDGWANAVCVSPIEKVAMACAAIKLGFRGVGVGSLELPPHAVSTSAKIASSDSHNIFFLPVFISSSRFIFDLL